MNIRKPPRTPRQSPLTLGAALLGLLASLTTCATGKEPPATTRLVSIVDVSKPFQFGSGEWSCDVPQSDAACAASKGFIATPAMQVQLKPFAIDAHEVTNAQYRYCVQVGVCSNPKGDNGPSGFGDLYHINSKFDDFPVVQVSWLQAKEYCAFVGKRLPTEFEWERAASGPGNTKETKRIYPWLPASQSAAVPPQTSCDKDVNLPLCNAGASVTRKVSTSKDDVVTEGGQAIYDLAGNVAEFTASDENATLGCDTAQPYDCQSCLTCLAQKPLATCNVSPETCGSCVCGKDSNAPTARPNCFSPCNSPVCPKQLLDAAPYNGAFTGLNFTKSRIVRGGSYFQQDVACAGRSDNRKLTRGPDQDPMVWLGFRCAKDL